MTLKVQLGARICGLSLWRMGKGDRELWNRASNPAIVEPETKIRIILILSLFKLLIVGSSWAVGIDFNFLNIAL